MPTHIRLKIRRPMLSYMKISFCFNKRTLKLIWVAVIFINSCFSRLCMAKKRLRNVDLHDDQLDDLHCSYKKVGALGALAVDL